MRLQEYDFVVRHIAGVENVVADGLSRLLVYQQLLLSSPINEWGPHVVQSLHNGLVGHFGISKTIQRAEEMCLDIKEQWPSYRADITAYIKKCWVCQKLKPSTSVVPTGFHHLHSDRPFASISIDTMGPLPKDTDGMKFVIVVMCNFSKYVLLFASPSTEACHCLSALIEWCCLFGIPEELRTDGGSQFTAKLIDQLTSYLGIRSITIVPYHPQANGLVERKIGEVKKHLKALVMEAKILSVWSRYLPLVQMILVNTTDSSTGVRAAHLVFGSKRDVLGMLLSRSSGTHQSPSSTVESLENVIMELDQALTSLIGASQQHLKADTALRDAKRASLMPKTADISFNVGDYVLMAYPELPPTSKSALQTAQFIFSLGYPSCSAVTWLLKN